MEKVFLTGRDQERETDESKLANQIARLLAIVPAPHTQPSNRSLLLYDKSGETGFQCDLCNGGFHVICIPDSLLQIYKGKRAYKNALLCQTNVNEAKSALFVSRNEETKCLCFYFAREWRSSLVTVSDCIYNFCCYHVPRTFSARLNLAVTKDQRRTIVFGEDY